jgi:hypothetical protein
MFAPLDNTLPLVVGQFVDGLQQRSLERRRGMHEQVDLHGPPGCNLASFKRFYADVAAKVQQFVALVEAHVYILCIGWLRAGL